MNKKFFALITAVVMIISLAAAPVSANGAVNLITNGDFEAGNTGFTTQYTYLDPSITGGWTLGPPYMYTIGTNPGLYHSGWLPGFGDHTTGTGKMMIVNGTTSDPAKIVWAQDVTGLTCVPDLQAPLVTTYRLIADGGDPATAWDAGEVQIKFMSGKIYIRMVTDGVRDGNDGWLNYGMKVAIASTCADIPQKNGNPIPGKFDYQFPFPAGTLDTGWQEIPYTGDFPVCIAAHADLRHAAVTEQGHMEQYEFCVVSGTGTDLAGGGDAVITAANTWANVKTTVNSIPDCLDTANYIWDAAFVTNYVADNGGMVDFVQGFNIIGTPTSATLKIAADNAYAWHINSGTEIPVNLAPDWRTQVALGNFASADIQSDAGVGTPVVILDGLQTAWGVVNTYDVLSSLNTGANTLFVTALNADWNTTNPLVNPAMTIYKICGTSEEYVVDVPSEPYESETGWGEGHEFDGSNWAMCIEYTPEYDCDYGSYRLEFYAASSYPAAPAQLEVKINGVVVPPTLLLTSEEGEWVKYSAEWIADDTHAVIEIRDLRLIYQGDDFCIDDISFVKIL